MVARRDTREYLCSTKGAIMDGWQLWIGIDLTIIAVVMVLWIIRGPWPHP
jgi:hypothetical protein